MFADVPVHANNKSYAALHASGRTNWSLARIGRAHRSLAERPQHGAHRRAGSLPYVGKVPDSPSVAVTAGAAGRRADSGR